MKNRIQEINEELEKISQEISKLFDKERKLEEEKNKLLLKELFDDKFLNRYKWRILKRDAGPGFVLEPICNDKSKFDDIQTKLKLYPHGSFLLTKNVEIIGSDGDLYIISSDIKNGIKFIKSHDIDVNISKSIIDKITSMEEQVANLKEFVDKFDKMADDKNGKNGL